MSHFTEMLQKLHSKAKQEDPKEPQEETLLNCWEFKKCGKEKTCIAATDKKYNGYFGGKNGGRFCPFISGTECYDGSKRSTFEKLELCVKCDFYNNIVFRVFPNRGKK
ncbi:MAG: hypothetical protein H7839_18270 [Magnetococcus sp. YQC-5]